MLSLLLGLGVLSRQGWGAISDRIGGLSTLLISSVLQGLAMTGFVVTQDEVGPVCRGRRVRRRLQRADPGLCAGGARIFPGREASWRVPVVLLLSGSGMAAGTWLAGWLYDYFGYYAPAFATGVAFNLDEFHDDRDAGAAPPRLHARTAAD